MTRDFLDMLCSRMFFPLKRCPTRITANKAIAIFMHYPLVPRRRQQERHKFSYLTLKNNSFARFARAFFSFGHLTDLLVLSTTWNDLFCRCGRRERLMRSAQFCLLNSKALVSFNLLQDSKNTFCQRLVLAFNNWEMIAEMRSYMLDDFLLSWTLC